MLDLIWVQPGLSDGRVALLERHPQHPTGEAFVTGPPVQVALTPAVERRLASGVLVQVDAPKPPVEEPPKHKTREEIQREIEALGGKAVGNEDAPKPTPDPFDATARAILLTNFDGLSAKEIVEQAGEWSAELRATLYAYEAASGGRVTVLAALQSA